MNRTITRTVAGVAAGATAFGIVAPAVGAAADASDGGGPNIVDIVLEVSGTEGFDDNAKDYDLLREALLATGLAGAVATTDDITVFAPRDGAFVHLARDLGYDGTDEAGSFAYLAEVTGFESADDPGLLDDVLLYHVSPGAKTVRELRRTHPITTLLEGATLEVWGNRVIDLDPNDRDARFRNPKNLEASNGIVHTVNRVLRPLDLEPPPPPAPDTVVDIVLETSGAEGFDRNLRDYDLLREALVATGLVTAVAEADDITVLAPTDYSFLILAYQLGYRGGFDEAAVFGFLAEATGFESAENPGILADVLLYHVLPGSQSTHELRGSGEQPTLLTDADGNAVTLDFGRFRIGDNDPNSFNPFFVRPSDLVAGNGVVHSIFGVLRPIDL